jgi:hypothetical protein
MRKLRADSCWNDLSAEQWDTLEGWLLDENITYREAQERIVKEWGLTRSASSLVRLRRYLSKKRSIHGLRDAMQGAKQVNRSGANLEELRDSVRRVLSKRYFDLATTGENVGELAVLGRLLSQSEEREIRRLRLAFARERWQFRTAKQALKLLPMLNEMSKEDEERDNARIQAVRVRLFGPKVPDATIK